MKFGPVPLAQAAGKILAHTVLDLDGRKLLNKGRRLTPEDLDRLRALNYEAVTVAALEPTDLDENEAAQRVGAALAGPGIRVRAPGVGRANLIAGVYGPLRVNVPLLEYINHIDEGIQVATLHTHTLVQPGQLVALVKIIPFAVPAARVVDVEAITRAAAPLLTVNALQPRSVALIVSGPAHARETLMAEFVGPVSQRITRLGSALDACEYVTHAPEAIAGAIREQAAAGRGLVLLAGISAIIDREDVAPQALKLAGGSLTTFGVPVDPGNLLMLGYVGEMPVVGAPGCVKSLKTNVIDWLLPRLLAGERLTRADMVAMGHGGLLDDIRERPMPRQVDVDGE